MAIRALTVQGSYVGNPKELRELVKLAQDGSLPALPVATVPQSQANDALMRLRDGKVTGRLVLKADGRAMCRRPDGQHGHPPLRRAEASPARRARVRISKSGRTRSRTGTRRGGDAHHLAVDRSLHARPAARSSRPTRRRSRSGDVMTGETVGRGHRLGASGLRCR